MRTNKKDSLLAIALSIVESDGLAALTYDSLSIASGISKSGLIYHFPSRHQLLLDLNTAAAQTWTQALEAAAGGPASEVPLRQRMHALLEVESHSATRADLLLSIDANLHEDIRSIWEKALAPWIVSHNPHALLVQLIADGLWVYDHVNARPLTPKQRQAAVDAAQLLLRKLPNEITQ
ncbi:TetR/AcrR family transcriptional regulator [Corynebacterium pseudotuberculosis]|uniref:TetR/AcrR family transcriptional regulator n=1 Tax=Corynebacterium pseudotuberculosis TaxID=1719 RepID=UPI0001E5F23A|nr:TetR/AcrR family transcriptional regulator [Corynebacterium pseudotuberculosis]ADO27004.3 TetR family transcriptional regulator [Corynebacterium pseudotuberculosis I19]AFH52693.1 TetR-family regulatory protein [Corynebacterium pseudotuberculosis 267]AKC74514.1 Hypothetical protein Cp226_1815 [Corynebacterium pseudotuberculosis]AKI59269.1 TetR/AcrR family transcriptional regulator [Corynebacterium pseudotuberculosis]ALU17407.1 TetR family transcriptional regulator [Corynebacterium pseudotube